ncbi:GD25721 [Drosophila simulans]|uniref:GD25721 n=1 Tax=Drosophila simulans TaxID=7240 RepID=B4QEX1_DROSI|nr:GD25721 [Drosophila simulans]
MAAHIVVALPIPMQQRERRTLYSVTHAGRSDGSRRQKAAAAATTAASSATPSTTPMRPKKPTFQYWIVYTCAYIEYIPLSVPFSRSGS